MRSAFPELDANGYDLLNEPADCERIGLFQKAACCDDCASSTGPCGGGCSGRCGSGGGCGCGSKHGPDDLASLAATVAARHGRDTTAEWFVPVFKRQGRLILGREQRAPNPGPWHPDPGFGMQAGDLLAATIHTHTTTRDFSDDDIRAGDRLGVPMVLIEPGARSALVYDPSSGTVGDLGTTAATAMQGAPLLGGYGAYGGLPTNHGLHAAMPRITISEPVPDPKLLANIVNVARTLKGATDKEVLFIAVAPNPELAPNANKLSADLLKKIIAVARAFPRATDKEVLFIASLPPTPQGSEGARLPPSAPYPTAPPRLPGPAETHNPALPPPCSGLSFVLSGTTDPLIQAIVWAIRACPQTSQNSDYVKRALEVLRCNPGAAGCDPSVYDRAAKAAQSLDPNLLAALIIAVRLGIVDPARALTYAQNVAAPPSVTGSIPNDELLRELINLARDPTGLNLPWQYILVLALRKIGLDFVPVWLDQRMVANIVSRARVFPNETADQILAFAKGATFDLTAVSPFRRVDTPPLELVEALMYCASSALFLGLTRDQIYSCARSRVESLHPGVTVPASIDPSLLTALINAVRLDPSGSIPSLPPEEILARAVASAQSSNFTAAPGSRPATLSLRDPTGKRDAADPLHNDLKVPLFTDATEVVTGTPFGLPRPIPCSANEPCEATYTPGWWEFHEGEIQSLVFFDQPYSGAFGHVGVSDATVRKALPSVFCGDPGSRNPPPPSPGCPRHKPIGHVVPKPDAVGDCLLTNFSMLTTQIGTAANNYALPAVTAKIEHPIELAIRFSRGRCPLFVPFAGVSAEAEFDTAAISEAIRQGIQSKINEAMFKGGVFFLTNLLWFISYPFLALTGGPTPTITPLSTFIQPHFFVDHGRYRGGLAVGATFHSSVSTIFGGEQDIVIHAAYALDPGTDKFVRATALPQYMLVDAGSHSSVAAANVAPYLGNDCRGAANCVVDLIEKAFEDALDTRITRPGQPPLTIRQALRFAYPPDGLTSQDILAVNVLPTGFDFVVRPEKCTASWRPNFETVDFEPGLVPVLRPTGYAGYCSFGAQSV